MRRRRDISEAATEINGSRRSQRQGGAAMLRHASAAMNLDR
jgi:hypothetical protein